MKSPYTYRLKHGLLMLCCMVFALGLYGCSLFKESENENEMEVNTESIYQVSTIDALSKGFYYGELSCEKLKENGDFGIGTFEDLDGEMVVVDGEMFQIKNDGEAVAAEGYLKSPFAVVTYFDEDHSAEIGNIGSITELEKQLDKLIESRNIFYAIRIDGTFEYIKTRSVPKQKEPYPLLADALKKQVVFELGKVEGTIAGFWCPDYMYNINVPGYHLHFITEDRQKGGHLLECRLTNGTVKLDAASEFSLALPESDQFKKFKLGEADKSKPVKIQ